MPIPICLLVSPQFHFSVSLFYQFEISTKFQIDSFDCVVEKSAAGPELPRDSYNTDLFVTYVDKWMWDITLYLLELTITLESSELAALGRRQLLRHILDRKSRDEMVDEVLANMLNVSVQLTAP